MNENIRPIFIGDVQCLTDMNKALDYIKDLYPGQYSEFSPFTLQRIWEPENMRMVVAWRDLKVKWLLRVWEIVMVDNTEIQSEAQEFISNLQDIYLEECADIVREYILPPPEEEVEVQLPEHLKNQRKVWAMNARLRGIMQANNIPIIEK